MTVSIEELYGTQAFLPNEQQRQAIETIDGPLRIIAGPGSGKTHVLVLRALNLLACREVEPRRVVLITFTEKAARQLEDRLRLYASRLKGARVQLAEVNVGTIHWFCGTLLRKYHPEFRRYEPMDQLGQVLFVYDRLEKIAGDLKVGTRYLGKWGSKSTAVEGIIPWFSKITEETIRAEQLLSSSDTFLQQLGLAYSRYKELLLADGHLDFSLILRELHDLFAGDAQALAQAQDSFSYYMVDEYQDTNYVQEEILVALAGKALNLAVVGDDDQSLYRFRGAEVRNILQFPDRLSSLGAPPAEVQLTINYRSHPKVIDAYLDFMNDGNWTDGSTTFRTGHTVTADHSLNHEDYPGAVFMDANPTQLADLVESLLLGGAVNDPNQIALLFHSVSHHAQEVINELKAKGIQCFAPRSGKFLDNREVRYAVGVLWMLGGFDADSGPESGPVSDTCAWAIGCLETLKRAPDSRPLIRWLEATRARFDGLRKDEDMSASLLDLFYRAIRYAPFKSVMNDPPAARNLGHFTTLLRTFQQQFRFQVLNAGNRSILPWRLWASFFYLLDRAGVDDLDLDEGAPPGLVQVMTIHQAKGLEFPVVIVGSLNKRPRGNKEINRALGQFYPRGPFEPESRITEFDHRREFYVAFSRAQHLLVAYSDGTPHANFAGLAQRLPDARSLNTTRVAKQLPKTSLGSDEMKPLLSLTSHINVFRTCRRQYQFFREYGFAPSFAAQVFFGTVVHQTIEDIHRHTLDGRPEPLTTELIRGYFDRNSELLRRRGIHPLAPNQRNEAFKHVTRYFEANKDQLHRVEDTEVEVTLEQPQYVLNGRVDLIRGDDDVVELVDFKAMKRQRGMERLDGYKDQLALYRYLLEDKYGERPGRTVLYFTGEDDPQDARLVVNVTNADLEDVKRRFDDTALEIIGKNFELLSYPSRETCRACDFQNFCQRTDKDVS